MRKYKFRGKRKDNGEWVHGGIYVDQGKVGILTTEIINAIAIIDEVDPATVGQYTGLKDKNGVEIYEHGIVKVYFHNGLYLDEWIEEIVFEKGQFGIKHGYGYKWFSPLSDFFKPIKKEYVANVGEVVTEWEPTFEIIGNIHDNPELLGVG